MQSEEQICYEENPNIAPGSDAARRQMDRILRSNTFHASEILRRLLRFLADKSFAGEADDLKEYSIGIDALGKPSTYDPRQDAAVRLHASRLRQKLEDYYRNEGKTDSLIIELPKGRFKIVWHVKEQVIVPVAAPLQPAAAIPDGQKIRRSISPGEKTWRSVAIGSSIAALLFGLLAVWSLAWTLRPRASNLEAGTGPTPELGELWSPFLSAGHHLIIAFVNPLYVRLQREGGKDFVYRMSGNVTWDDAISSPEFPVLKKLFGTPVAKPTYNLVERSNLISTFYLSQFFARRRADISLARADELSWQQFADNDIIMFGPLALDDGQMALPVRPVLTVDRTGIRNPEPRPGEPSTYSDPANHSPGNGEALQLVSVMPGPLGRTTVMTFSGNNKWAVIGGVQALTDPKFAREVVNKLKAPSGKFPAYYQLLLSFKYRDGTLTKVSYLTHRELTMSRGVDEVSSTK